MKDSFGSFFKKKRLEKNLTQKQLANTLYVSESTVSKWENDAARPDLSLLPELAEILGVSEHELITASIDDEYRKEKSQAKKWRTFSFSWQLCFYVSYGIALLTCFICNLATRGTLDWFFIVLAALTLGFTFTNLPSLIKKHKPILIPSAMLAALLLLLGVCAIYSGGNWFFVAAASILFGLIVVFFPIYAAKYDIPSKIKFGKALPLRFVTLFIDFIALNALLLIIRAHVNGDWYLSVALPITLIAYFIMNVYFAISKLKTLKTIKVGIMLFLTAFLYLIPSIIPESAANDSALSEIRIINANFSIWNGVYVSRNTNCLVFLAILFSAVLCLTVGLILLHRTRKAKN